MLPCGTRRPTLAALGLAVAIATLLSAASASAAVVLPLKNWAVYGSLTPKKLNEPVVLPKGSTFNGSVSLTKITETEIEGTVGGKLFVPPFHAMLKLVGLVPTDVGVTLSEVGESKGTVTTAPSADCAHARFGHTCTTLNVTSEANMGLTETGLLGIEIPTHCETAEPIVLALTGHLTGAELTYEAHFAGTTTIPSIKCEGLEGIVLGTLLTTLISGPENPYKLGLAPHEPTVPAVEALSATSVSQVSAEIHGNAEPSGEPMTECRFEYGTELTYGTSVPCPAKGTTNFAREANLNSVLLTGLKEATTYHYRIVATNSVGTGDSPDATFTTLGRAGEPEFGVCVTEKGGEYRDAGCISKAKKAKKGKFEWQPAPAPTCYAHLKGEYTNSSCSAKSAKPHKGSFEKRAGPLFTSSSGPLTLETGAGKLTCAAGSGTGEITSAVAGVERITFTGCELAGKKCTSEGSNGTASGTAGSIETNLLTARLLGPVAGQVWTELVSAEHQPYLAEFACESGKLVRLKGSLSGVQGGDVAVASATGTTSFAAGSGEQGLVSELSEAAPAASVATMALNETTELATEIRP